MVVELLTPTFLRHSMLRLRPPCLKRLFRLEADDINLVAVLPCVPFDRDETGDGFDELVHPARRLCVLFLVSAGAQVSLEQHHDFRGILHSSIGQPPPPPSRSLLGVVRCLGSNTFSASSADRIPFSITSCFTVFPVRPDSFAISAAFSYPIRRFRVVAMAGLDSAYRCSTSMFALIPSMHRSANTRDTFASSSMFCERRCDITVIIVHRSRLEWEFATAIATSLPITVTPTCMTASGMTGFTFPGMIDEPGWTGGRLSSLRPV